MNFTITLRQAPLRLAGHSVSQLTKSTLRSSTPFRAFHQAAKTRSSASAPLQSAFFFSSTNAFRSGASSSPLKSTLLQQARGYAQYRVDEGVVSQVPPQSVLRRLLIGTAVFGGTLLVVNGVFNRETREDGGMPPYERSYLNSAFLHTGIGVATIGLAARQMVNTGFVYRMMITSPWIVALAGLGLSFGTMIGTRAVAPDK